MLLDHICIDASSFAYRLSLSRHSPEDHVRTPEIYFGVAAMLLTRPHPRSIPLCFDKRAANPSCDKEHTICKPCPVSSPLNKQSIKTLFTMAQHAVLLGASKGAGYHALLRLLTPDSTWSATVLLRKPEVIEKDENFAPYINDGRLRIVQGDATNVEDVKKLFKDKTDVVISTVGAQRSDSLHTQEIERGEADM
jgi:hypothetical protein